MQHSVARLRRDKATDVGMWKVASVDEMIEMPVLHALGRHLSGMRWRHRQDLCRRC